MPLDGINSAQFDKFAAFASEKVAGNGGETIARLGNTGAVRAITAADPERDSVHKIRRDADESASNDRTRTLFRKAVADLFGGEMLIPLDVQKAMILKDYGHGKPLTARRIDAVRQAVERHFADYPAAFAQAKALARNACARFPAQEVDAAIAQALSGVIDDPDATKRVVRSMDKLLVSDDAQLLPPEDIRKKVQVLLANLQELRSGAKDNRLAFEAGFDLLLMLFGRTLPTGMFGCVFGGVKHIPVKEFKGVKPGCGAARLHQAVGQFVKASKDLLARSGTANALKGAPERFPFQSFVGKLMLAKCNRRDLHSLHQTLHGAEGRKLQRFYEDFASGNIAAAFIDATPQELQEMRQLAPQYGMQMSQLDHLLAETLGPASDSCAGLPEPTEKIKYADEDIAGICGVFLETVQTNPAPTPPENPAI